MAHLLPKLPVACGFAARNHDPQTPASDGNGRGYVSGGMPRESASRRGQIAVLRLGIDPWLGS